MDHVIRIASRLRADIWRAMRWLDNHWVGDLIGAACLFLTFWIGLLFVGVYQ